MHRPHGRWPHWLLLWAAVLSGCQPRHPIYLRHDEGLATYIDAATELAYPDVKYASLDETVLAHAPLTLRNPEFHTFWDLTLQEAMQTALHNSKVIRTLGPGLQDPTVLDRLIVNPEGVGTIYDPAIAESDPQFGVEAALAAFDAQFASSLFWNTTDRPLNRQPFDFGGAGVVFPPVTKQRQAVFTAELSKRSATGTQFFFRNITQYDRSEPVTPLQPLPSFYTTQFETEVRHPLLRGNGARVNRVPILIARIRTDISLARFEGNVRNLVQDVENAYWNLHCAYRILQTRKQGRDITLEVWRANYSQLQAGLASQQLEAQARQQYYEFRALTEEALNNLYAVEADLRWLMGLATSDGRLIRPVDEPTAARVAFEWPVVSSEALVRSPELRIIKWFIKQRELELIAARNLLLPELNIVGLYRWYGAGDNLVNSDRNGLNFPQPGSTAFDVLTEGDFQESRVGFDFAFPVGFRREYASVRNAQLGLVREHARLEDAELDVTRTLAQALRNLEAQYALAQSQYNRLIAATDDVEGQLALVREGAAILGGDDTLRAVQRRAQTEELFYLALCRYNNAIAAVHFQKNSLLEYNNVFLAEGPWPEKAYFDAEGHARRRAASYYLDYGWTQPPPVSAGPAPQFAPSAEALPLFHPLPDAGMATPPEPILSPAPRSPRPPQPPPAELSPLPPPDISHAGDVQPGIAYQGLGLRNPALGPRYDAAPAVSPYGAPALPSSRREAAPAAYHAPLAGDLLPSLNRLPPTAGR